MMTLVHTAPCRLKQPWSGSLQIVCGNDGSLACSSALKSSSIALTQRWCDHEVVSSKQADLDPSRGQVADGIQEPNLK